MAILAQSPFTAVALPGVPASAGGVSPATDVVAVGLASNLLDNKATGNLDAFGTDIADYQATVVKGWDSFGWVRNASDTKYCDFLTAAPGSTGLIVSRLGDPRTCVATVKARL